MYQSYHNKLLKQDLSKKKKKKSESPRHWKEGTRQTPADFLIFLIHSIIGIFCFGNSFYYVRLFYRFFFFLENLLLLGLGDSCCRGPFSSSPYATQSCRPGREDRDFCMQVAQYSYTRHMYPHM